MFFWKPCKTFMKVLSTVRLRTTGARPHLWKCRMDSQWFSRDFLICSGRYMLISPSHALHHQFHDIVFYKKLELILGEHRTMPGWGPLGDTDCRPRGPAFIATGMGNSSPCPHYTEEGLLTLELVSLADLGAPLILQSMMCPH